MIEGVDYAAGSLTPKQLKGAGKKFVCRYLSHDAWKNLRNGEAKVLRAGGIDIVTVWESTATRALAGELAGIQDAKSAVALLKELEAPANAVVYFAVDFDATPAQQKAINAYLHGAVSVLGRDRVGVYGGYWVVKRALDSRICRYAWQTYAWSGGAWDRRAHIQQYHNGAYVSGVQVDLDRAMFADYGQWSRPLPPKVKWVRALVPQWVAERWAKRRFRRL